MSLTRREVQMVVGILGTGCWLWRGHVDRTGYGVFLGGSSAKRQQAHRAVYEMIVGPIPDGLVLDHLCRNRACVNPSHLEPVTNKVNVLRGTAPTALNVLKTHCPHGHRYDSIRTGTTWRRCRACRRETNRRWYANHRDTERVRVLAKYHATKKTPHLVKRDAKE